MKQDAVPVYAEWLHSLARRYRASQIKAALAVNSEMLKFYWSLGADIVRLEPTQPWGSGFMQHLGEDIRREIPEAGCFSCGNLYYMRWFFELYCMRPIFPQAGGKLKSRKGQLEPIVPQVGEQLPVEAYQNKFPADFASDLPDIEAIETDQTRRLQLLLEKNRTINEEEVNER